MRVFGASSRSPTPHEPTVLSGVTPRRLRNSGRKRLVCVLKAWMARSIFLRFTLPPVTVSRPFPRAPQGSIFRRDDRVSAVVVPVRVLVAEEAARLTAEAWAALPDR